MFRLLPILSLLGCGLILDLDPQEQELPVDASLSDTPQGVKDVDPDTLLADVGSPMMDGMVVRADGGGPDAGDTGDTDAGDTDAGDTDAGDPDAGIACTNNADCGESTDCINWTCDVGTCRRDLEPNNTRCGEDIYCTINMGCQEGVCTGGVPRECDGGVSRCSADACDEAAGRCIPMPINEGMKCAVPNGDGACMGGECEPVSCEPGFRACGDPLECIDPQISLFHCGGCNTGCSELLEICLLGRCVGI